MKTIPESRVCRICQVEKPITEFYEYRGEFDYYCKPCKMRKYNGRRATRFGPTEPSSEHAIQVLNRFGIVVEPGKLSRHKHLDLIAWGCVRIEVKYAKFVNTEMNKGFHFAVSKKQGINGLVADLVMFICDYGDHETYHIFPVDHPVISRAIRNHNRAIVYVPSHMKRHQHVNSGKAMLTKSLMDFYENAWQLIEVVRENYARRLQGIEPTELPIPRQLELI